MKNIHKLLLSSSAVFLLAACGETPAEEPATPRGRYRNR